MLVVPRLLHIGELAAPTVGDAALWTASHLTKPVRNSESEMITASGGAVAVPSAVRSSESTMIRIEGASDSTVSSAIS